MTQDTRNMLLAVVLSAMVLFGWTAIQERFFPSPKPAVTGAPVGPGGKPAAINAAAPAPGLPDTAAPAPGTPTAAVGAATGNAQQIIAATPRVKIVTPKLQGSINLVGARFDDLALPTYRTTIAKDAPPVRLLSPSGAPEAWFGQFGWTGAGAPPLDARWTADRDTLTPEQPVMLSWTSPAGVVFEQVVSVDKDFLFTVTSRIRNPGATPLTVRPFGLVNRLGEGHEKDAYNLHVGPIGVIDGRLKDSEVTYKKLREDGAQHFPSAGGWLGMTEKYWLAALIPDQKAAVTLNFVAAPDGRYQTDFQAPAVTVAPGGEAATTARFFAGAKESNLLDRYRDTLGIPHFDLAISWGWFIVIAQPIFKLLSWLFHLTGNFGAAIICLTLIVRAVLFPIANRQYASMAKMRVVQPKLKALQDRYKDDKVKLQQEMMALYKTEKVNPVAGCLPLFLQIPIFYALYKTLLVSIEMRHQPFVLWIKDLSAPDPLTPVNLFGLLNFQPPAPLALGVLPILLGITMWLQQKLNPATMDPVQKQVFGFMPWVFMFIMAPFAAGLQLYWCVNNLVSIAQQAYMNRKYPVPATPEPAK